MRKYWVTITSLIIAGAIVVVGICKGADLVIISSIAGVIIAGGGASALSKHTKGGNDNALK